MKKLLWIGLAFLVVLVGCDLTSRDFYRAEGDFPEDGTGMLVLILDSSEIPTSKTLEPATADIIMDADRFDIYFDGPVPDGTADWSVLDHTSAAYAENGLEVGNYTVRVVAKNAATGKVVGAINGAVTNTVTFTIPENDIIQVDANVIPIIGDGDFDVTVDWEAGALATPVITAYLVPPSGNPTSPGSGDAITFSIDNDTNYRGTYSEADLTTGYYTLIIDLNDGATDVWGLTEAVRIVNSETTAHTYSLTLNGAGGYSLAIDVDLHNPYDIGFSTTSTLPLESGASLIVDATAAQLLATVPTGYTYRWQWFMDGGYISGADVVYNAAATNANTAPITYVNSGDDTLSSGSHNLCVLLTVLDSGAVHTISSECYNFEVE